jgi:hypothetical protein
MSALQHHVLARQTRYDARTDSTLASLLYMYMCRLIATDWTGARSGGSASSPLNAAELDWQAPQSMT